MSSFSDLSAHTGTLVAIIGALFTLCGGLLVGFWKIGAWLLNNLKGDLFELINRVEAKVDSHLDDSAECQRNLPLTYMVKEDAEKEFAFLKGQQYELRQNILPRDYVRAETLRAWEETMKVGFREVTARLEAVSTRLDSLLGIKLPPGRKMEIE